jgi:hypothetical protein
MAGLLDAAVIESNMSEASYMVRDAAVSLKELNEAFTQFEARD